MTSTGTVLTVTFPDGGFRRLVVETAGWIVAADGAQAARVSRIAPHDLDVRIGGDRFVLPEAMAR